MKPLAHKTRRKIFWILMIIFVCVAPVIVSKSLGYRLGQLGEVFTWVKTGGIYLHSNINNASIYVNGSYVESNGLLLRNTLIQDLEPDTQYEVVVQKEGLHDWRKTLTVYPSLVTEARVLMMPVDIQKTAVYPYGDIDNVGTTTAPYATTTKNAEYVLLETLFDGLVSSTTPSTDVVIATTTATSTLDVPEYFVALGITNPDTLENLVVRGDQVAWLDNGNIELYWVGQNKVSPYYFCLTFSECRTHMTIDWEKPILSFDFLPGRDDVFIIRVSDTIYAVEIDDRSDRNIQPLYSGAQIDFRITARDQIIVRDGNIFYKLDL